MEMTGVHLIDEKMPLAPFLPSIQETNDVSKIRKTTPPYQKLSQDKLFVPPRTGESQIPLCLRGARGISMYSGTASRKLHQANMLFVRGSRSGKIVCGSNCSLSLARTRHPEVHELR